VIVTRRRRKPFPWRRLILPVVAIGLVVFAFAWPPSRNVITGGPLSPLLQNVGSRFDTIAAPFHFAAQNQVLTDRNRQIMQLQSQITELQAQSAASSRNAATSPSAAPAAGAAAQSNPAAAEAGSSDTTSNATPEMRRTAQVWANMQPENAAKVVQRLPIPYVAEVLALMSPDDAGSILDAVPPAFAAQVTQENPSLKR
jgi:MgtE intracellular N domain